MKLKYYVLWMLEAVGIFINSIPYKEGIIITKTIGQTVTMLEMLPEQEQDLALELVKRLVLAWDPDYTKLTPSERARLEEAENGEYINAKDIVWDD